MGSLYSAVCPCGYESRSLYEGSGFRMKSFTIWQCERCHEFLVSGDETCHRRCSFCGSRRLKPIADPQTANGLACPNCGKSQLSFWECGLWD